jgi:hypothetical protein
MAEFKPFENDEQSWSGGEGDGLTINNGVQTLSIYGEIKFTAADQGGLAARELLSIFSEISKQLPEGEGSKSLWVKTRAGAVVIGGDIDVEKGKSGQGALAKATIALERLVSGPKPAEQKKDVKPKA